MTLAPRFAELLAEARVVPVAGWDFSWFDGRAREERPSWAYARLLSDRMAVAGSALDLQTGGGEVLATIVRAPPTLLVTESWRPNIPIAHRNLHRLGASVIQAADYAPLPVRTRALDLVTSRHPTVVRYDEIRRVLRPDGVYLAQQIGAGSNRELYEFLMGPQPHPAGRQVDRTRAALAAAGFETVRVEVESLRVEFDDIAAVVVFLRKVVWTVPDFTIERYQDRLLALHQRIETDGPFIAHSQRVLVEARRPVRS